VDFRLEDVEETFFADLLAGFRSLEDCSGFSAESTEFGSHGFLAAGGWVEVKLRVWSSDRAEEKRVRVMTRSAHEISIPSTVVIVPYRSCIGHPIWIAGVFKSKRPEKPGTSTTRSSASNSSRSVKARKVPGYQYERDPE
jgi:hypothetical protein